ncbi:hypothetical protein BCR33DRAFT_462555 [Rhizoclosmatium globosum]|uniref:Uncharacterized protein n=1 Tax=Rhizoclosmatium globosum TaxID=329046 RepID=A0A1Y2BRQ4_9FUNG|nr:hypothetical protein BCR33DRAFT_462555 [Rhizoclosmatium globosum]|eukprot:ORY37404.1 hypothetical protein BCR33DRAFT_462555 [Rhizoclosmatium globosum]
MAVLIGISFVATSIDCISLFSVWSLTVATVRLRFKVAARPNSIKLPSMGPLLTSCF